MNCHTFGIHLLAVPEKWPMNLTERATCSVHHGNLSNLHDQQWHSLEFDHKGLAL